MPELQGEPEDISKEKARLAALQVAAQAFLLLVQLLEMDYKILMLAECGLVIVS